MKKLVFLVLIIFFLGVCKLFAGTLEKKVDIFKVENIPLEECILKLSRISNVPICIEEVLNPYNKRRKISLELKNIYLRQILDEIIKIFPNYTWTFDKETNIVNIFPKENSPLGWYISNISIKNKSLKEIFYDKDLLKLEKHNIYVEIKNIIGFIMDEKTTYSLEIHNSTVRLVINKLCSKLNFNGNKARWSLLPKISSLDNKTYYVLLIHEIIPLKTSYN